MGQHQSEPHEVVSDGAILALNLVDYVSEHFDKLEKPEINGELYDCGPLGRLEVAQELGKMLSTHNYYKKRHAIEFIMGRTEIVHALTGYQGSSLRKVFSANAQASSDQFDS